jgi:hypothetical protein
MNEQDKVDFSKFQDFFETDIRYYSNKTLDAAITELITERNRRTPHKWDHGFEHDMFDINDQFTKLFKDLGINRRRTEV